jgi:transposase-like protein
MVGGIENEGESMPRTRKSHPPSLKAKVAVEAIKAHKTAAQIAQMFGVLPTQVGGWRRQALAGFRLAGNLHRASRTDSAPKWCKSTPAGRFG